MSGKLYLKDKLEDDELDLSMMQLTDVPVKEIEQLGSKVLKLNLSHNLLTSVPANLPLLTHLTSIDLSKNQIVELPENFGQLTKLKSLDLYSNQISKLPVSFAQLKSLKWLDLKENPLVPELAKAAGPCLTKTDCELAAKKVVARLQSIESQLFQEKKKRLEQEEKLRKQRERKEEAERERIRQEKKLAKEKRREEAKMKEVDNKQQSTQTKRQEGQNGNSPSKKSNLQNGYYEKTETGNQSSGFSIFKFLLKMMMMLFVVGISVGLSLIWVYTEGEMDNKSIQKATLEIQKDVYLWTKEADKRAKPYLESAVKQWKNLEEKAHQGFEWVRTNYGDQIKSVWENIKKAFQHLRKKCEELYKQALPYGERVWKEAQPYLRKVGQQIVDQSRDLWTFLQTNVPVYVNWIKAGLNTAYQNLQIGIQNLLQAN